MNDSTVRWVAAVSIGFLPADLYALYREAVRLAHLDTRFSEHDDGSNSSQYVNNEIYREHFERALYNIRPSMLQSKDRFSDDMAAAMEQANDMNMTDRISHGVPHGRNAFCHLHGLKRIHRKLNQILLRPIAEPTQLLKYGIPNPRGVLLYGPPGTGKTATGLALKDAVYGKANFLCVTCTSIVDKELGATEKASLNEQTS